MSRLETNNDKIITEWIIEYAQNFMWQKFRTFKLNPTSSDEFIRGVIMKAQSTGFWSRESLLTEWLFLIYYGCNLYDNGSDITPLEKAISMLPRLTENFRSLKKMEVNEVERLLKEQAVLVCIERKEFSLAKTVKDRIWTDTMTHAEEKISRRLELMIQSKPPSGFDASSFKDLIESVRKLLEDLCENQLPCPYLIRRASEERNKKVCDEDKMVKNLSAAIRTDIILTGSALSAFISKYKLKAEFGVGFESQDKFQSAVESLRSRKDQLLKSVPVVSSTTVDAEIENVSPEPDITEKAVSSISLKRKLREQSSGNCPVRKPSSVSAEESLLKDSRNDSSNDREKPFDISLRKRVGEPSFQGVERQQSPKKTSEQQVKRKPRSKWTADEEKAVYKAVQKYGVSSWASIASANILPGRSNVDIKDKWRTMVKTGRDKELKDEVMSELSSSSDEN